MTTWIKLPVLDSTIIGCLTCGYTPKRLSLKRRICAGFGETTITRDGEVIFSECGQMEWNEAPTLKKFENMARKDPDHDWRCKFYLPLRDAEYQRQGDNQWLLVKTGMGFA